MKLKITVTVAEKYELEFDNQEELEHFLDMEDESKLKFAEDNAVRKTPSAVLADIKEFLESEHIDYMSFSDSIIAFPENDGQEDLLFLLDFALNVNTGAFEFNL